MDNKAAEAKGGSTTKGVDISMAFNNEVELPVFEKAAAEDAAKTAYCNTTEASTSTMPSDAMFLSWSANDTGDTHLATHTSASGIPHKIVRDKSMVETLTKMKNECDIDPMTPAKYVIFSR